MLAQLFGAIDISMSEIAIPMAAGLTGGALSLLAAKLLTGQRRNQHTAPADETYQRDAYDPFYTGSSTEKRLALRRKGNRVEIFVEPVTDRKKPYTGWVFDRSVNGLGILVDRPVPKGEMLMILPVNAPSVTPWVEVEVKNCRETKEGWEIGCSFPKQPPWAILLQFG